MTDFSAQPNTIVESLRDAMRQGIALALSANSEAPEPGRITNSQISSEFDESVASDFDMPASSKGKSSPRTAFTAKILSMAKKSTGKMVKSFPPAAIYMQMADLASKGVPLVKETLADPGGVSPFNMKGLERLKTFGAKGSSVQDIQSGLLKKSGLGATLTKHIGMTPELEASEGLENRANNKLRPSGI